MSQEGMDECWKRLAEKMEEDVLDKSKVEDSKRGAYRSRGLLFWNEACTKKHQVRNTKMRRRLLGKNLRLVQGTKHATSEKA